MTEAVIACPDESDTVLRLFSSPIGRREHAVGRLWSR